MKQMNSEIPIAVGRRAKTFPRRPNIAVKAVQLGFPALMVVVVAGGLWNIAQQRPKGDSPPGQLADAKLLRLVEGPQALQMVEGLHQGSPKLTGAWVAYYERGGVVWSGTALSSTEAQDQLQAMAQAIGKGGTPFSNLRTVSLAGRQVFAVSDSERDHYFFQDAARVIWVTSPWANEAAFIEAALRGF